MDLKSLNLSTEQVEAIQLTRMKVELHEKQNIRASRSVEELVQLLLVALASEAEPVQKNLARLAGLLSADQHAFFRTLGVDLGQSPARKEANTYRGQRVARQEPSLANEQAAQEDRPKKKVIYRGQVKWV